MKNILAIIRQDLKRISSSVVAIITVMGLCIVPCCYAWFNIFSNWSPYESEATGRIPVAVANMDEGAETAGLTVNVGDKIISALEANDSIGWVFVEDSEEAVEGVYAGDYYAALIIPEGFSSDVMSFAGGSLSNPKLVYYENEKKNAIAPKITGKAKTAVQEEVNAAFIETLASYVSDAASIASANDVDPAETLSELSDKIERLSMDLNSCIVLSESAETLTEAGASLLGASGTLIGSAQGVLDANDKLLDSAQENLPEQTVDTSARDDAGSIAKEISSAVTDLNKRLVETAKGGDTAYNSFVLNEKDKWKENFDSLQQSAASCEEPLKASDYTVLAAELKKLAARLGGVSSDLESLKTDMTAIEKAKALAALEADLAKADRLARIIKRQVRADVDAGLANALAKTKKSVNAFRDSLTSANSDLGSLSSMMKKYESALGGLESSVESTVNSLEELQDGSVRLSGILSNAAGSEILSAVSDLLAGDESAAAEYLAEPVKMDTEVIWPVENYGSAMAPFYTVLAQWVGALLTAVLIKVKLRKKDREMLPGLRIRQWYFGRYGLFLLVGIAQALIVSLGDLYYVRIQCGHPLLFILAACVNGIVFMMINYALVFALDNIGLGAAVIVLVIQVGGAGGTYPVEVLPDIFQRFYPLMPFRYSMDAMRECAGGMYGSTYWHSLGILMIFFAVFTAFGIAMYRPMLRINTLIAESKAKSEIML